MRERLLVGLADQVSAILKDGWKLDRKSVV